MPDDEMTVKAFYDTVTQQFEKMYQAQLKWTPALLEQAALAHVDGKTPRDVALMIGTEKKMEIDPNFPPKVPFAEDPEFKKLMHDLQVRQRQESKELEQKQMEQRIEFGRKEGVTREHLDENYKRQIRERQEQSRQHKAEYDRHIHDYHDAKVLREELKQREQERSLNPEQERGRSR
jgi:hypothetical protein